MAPGRWNPESLTSNSKSTRKIIPRTGWKGPESRFRVPKCPNQFFDRNFSKLDQHQRDKTLFASTRKLFPGTWENSFPFLFSASCSLVGLFHSSSVRSSMFPILLYTPLLRISIQSMPFGPVGFSDTKVIIHFWHWFSSRKLPGHSPRRQPLFLCTFVCHDFSTF